VRLPLQVGRASLNQGARYASCVWLGPLFLLLAAMFQSSWGLLAVFGFSIPALFFAVSAFSAAEVAKQDRASDIVIDASGFMIEGGPLDKTHGTWSKVRGCEIVKGEPRRAGRWLWFKRVPVNQLTLAWEGKAAIVLAEAEGDEIESLEQLRDSIRGAIAPPGEPAPLPQEILTCPHCSAPLVPAATPRMTCTYCKQDLDVPAELQQRVRASLELDQTSDARASLVRVLVDQPSARRAAAVIAACRRVMVWIQPVALGLCIALMVHSTSDAEYPAGIGIARTAPNDDGVFFYDLGLLALVVIGVFAIAWSVGHAYIANRQALRMLADHFGAVPPARPGAPSTCHQCSAPLPATTRLLVHCAYCAAENVLGVDPRPAAMRRKRERVDLARGLRRRRRATIQRWVTIPIAVLLGVVMLREVRLAWHVPEYLKPPWDGLHQLCGLGTCGHVANGDPIRRTVTFFADGKRVETTVLPHGIVSWSCSHGCSLELDKASLTPDSNYDTDLRIEHGLLKQVTP
jgi:hypothetical protein